MARLPRICPPGIPQHVIQRGNNRQICFVDKSDFTAYANWLAKAANAQSVAIHAWVLMTNHVHLLATPARDDGISKMMQDVGRRYVRYFNRLYGRSGTLWGGRFKSCIVDAEDYLLTCQRYIELNPVRARMVERPEDYPWSSYWTNGLGKASNLTTPHPIWRRMGDTDNERAQRYRQLFAAHLEATTLSEVRAAVNSGMALGNDRFRQEIERLTGRRVTPLKRGPKKKSVRGNEHRELLF